MIDESMSASDTDASADDAERRGGFAGFLRETAIVVGLSLLIATLVRAFLVQAFLIPSESMQETLEVGDRVLVSKVSLRFDDVHRGDVVVFEDPDNWLTEQPEEGDGVGDRVKRAFEWLGVLPDDSEGHLIKRVIAVGGDTVECCDDNGNLTVNDVPIQESDYLYPGDEPAETFEPVTVPEGELFVMGDHRSNSGDSRYNGTVAEDLVVGRAFAVVWPISRWDGLSRSGAFDAVPAPSR